MRLALFDLDGTITTKDSFFDFIIFSSGRFRLLTGCLILTPVLIVYFLKIIPNWKAKERFLSYFFAGMTQKNFTDIADKYATERLPKIIRKEALDRIAYHKAEGDHIVVVTASVREWLAAWCDSLNIDIISTELEIADDKITGRLLNKNCYGPEKVSRIKQKYNLQNYSYIFAYGDSKGDREMLSIANEKYYRWKRSDG